MIDLECKICNTVFTKKQFLLKHLREVHGKKYEHYNIYYVTEILKELPKCINCGADVFVNYYKISKVCKKWCRLATPEGIDNRKKYWTTENIKKVATNRRNNNLLKHGVENTSKLESVRIKLSESAIDRYSDPEFIKKTQNMLFVKHGVTNVSQLKSVQDKIKKVSNIKYGADHYLSSELRRYREELSNKWIPLDQLKPFKKYSKECLKETSKHIEQLFTTWDGYCYYENIVLKTNSVEYNDPLYRTIDHKISIYYGFINNINPVEIGRLDNLCICSRSYNSRKHISNE